MSTLQAKTTTLAAQSRLPTPKASALASTMLMVVFTPHNGLLPSFRFGFSHVQPFHPTFHPAILTQKTGVFPQPRSPAAATWTSTSSTNRSSSTSPSVATGPAVSGPPSLLARPRQTPAKTTYRTTHRLSKTATGQSTP